MGLEFHFGNHCSGWVKNIEFLWCVFKSFVSADELLLKFHVATFNLSSESKEENAQDGQANENVKQSSDVGNMIK